MTVPVSVTVARLRVAVAFTLMHYAVDSMNNAGYIHLADSLQAILVQGNLPTSLKRYRVPFSQLRMGDSSTPEAQLFFEGAEVEFRSQALAEVVRLRRRLLQDELAHEVSIISLISDLLVDWIAEEWRVCAQTTLLRLYNSVPLDCEGADTEHWVAMGQAAAGYFCQDQTPADGDIFSAVEAGGILRLVTTRGGFAVNVATV
jgi:hypothetical protein